MADNVSPLMTALSNFTKSILAEERAAKSGNKAEIQKATASVHSALTTLQDQVESSPSLNSNEKSSIQSMILGAENEGDKGQFSADDAKNLQDLISSELKNM